jgi:hypothetical protein
VTRLRAGIAALKALLADPVVRLVVLTRLALLVAAPVTLFLVAGLRPAAEQGFYFVFANVQAIAVLFEFGVGAMLVQFASHASTPLRAVGVPGVAAAHNDKRVLETLASARRWFNGAAVAVLAVVLPAGFALFRDEATRSSTAFSVAWVALTVSLAAYLTIVPSICVLEGSGHLRRVQRMRLVQALAATMSLWALIPVVGSLTAVAAATVVNLTVAGGWLFLRFPAYVNPFPPRTVLASDDAGMFSAQSRAAVNGVIGFLGPQLISPIVFHLQGAVAAGQIGLSLAAANAPLMLAVSWLQAKYPEYGTLVARSEFARLEQTARRATEQAVLAWLTSTAGLLILVAGLQRSLPPVGDRFLPIVSVAALSTASLGYLLYQAMAGQLRAHREETLLWPMVLGTAASIGATIAGAYRGASTAAVAHATAVLCVLLPLSVAAFVRRRRVLHTERSATTV